MAPQPIDPAIAAKVKDIKSQSYAKSIVAEDVIERNFGYKIIRQQIFSGKNTIVYKCQKYGHSDTYCLIKTIQNGKDKIKMALREETCQIMRYVSGKCAQIVSTYDIYYTNQKLYIMCDWAAKNDVVTNIYKRNVHLNEHLLRIWTIDIMNAINFLHSNGICHRNIAPSNLLLTHDDHIKLGILNEAVIYTQPDGTLIKQKWPKFSRSNNWNQAPEVAKGKLYDPRRADIWSFGATIFWIATGFHPLNYHSTSKMTKQLERNFGMIRKISQHGIDFIKSVLTYQPPSRPTIAQVMQLDWVAETRTPDKIDKEAEEILPDKHQETYETTGPEESPIDGLELSASRTNKPPNNDKSP